MTSWLLIGCLLAGESDPVRTDSQSLARQIDRRVMARLDAERVPPAARADDAEFLRRVSLDLIGRIPNAAEVLEFLADTNPAKRNLLIEKLLASPEHTRHFARVWRALLLPE